MATSGSTEQMVCGCDWIEKVVRVLKFIDDVVSFTAMLDGLASPLPPLGLLACKIANC